MTEKIFSSRQVLAAAVVGGPVAGVFALSRNFLAAGSLNDSIVMLPLIGWAMVFAYLLVFPYFSPIFSLGVVPVILCLAIYVAARSLAPEKWLKRRAVRWKYYEAPDVLKVAFGSLIAMAVAEFAWMQALAAG